MDRRCHRLAWRASLAAEGTLGVPSGWLGCHRLAWRASLAAEGTLGVPSGCLSPPGPWMARRALKSDQFLPGADQRPETLGEQGHVEGLLEALVDVGPVDRDLRAVVRQ